MDAEQSKNWISYFSDDYPHENNLDYISLLRKSKEQR